MLLYLYKVGEWWMEVNLINNDIDMFLNKYTRFMTKGIYINNIIYERFINNYKYLYDEVEKNFYLYKDSNKYKKMMSIVKNKNKLIRLHNKKYLDNTIEILDDSIDKNIRKILLCEEDRLLILDNKYINIIENKIKYDSKFDWLVVTDSYDKCIELRNVIEENMGIYDIDTLALSLLDDDFEIIDTHKKYQIISSYLKNGLYQDKYSFKKFAQVFKDGLYFNKDYLDFDTFHDYHSYMFKRMFLASNTTMEKFNQKMINKRRAYLRTINDELLQSKDEVDIANFLYLNTINYKYNNDNNTFTIWNGDVRDTIRYTTDSLKSSTNIIIINNKYKDKTKPLDHLVYELIKRRYPMELLDDEVVYNRLKDTCEDGYFSNLLSRVIIPLLDNYDNLSRSNIDALKKEVLREIYIYYKKYLNQNKLLDRNDAIKLIKDKITDKYDFIILVEDNKRELSNNGLDAIFKKSIIINYNYQNDYFISNNIKDIYEYKKYLNNNKLLPINNIYIGYKEIEIITTDFINYNIDNIDKSFNKNKVNICEFDDSKRLVINQNKSKALNEILFALTGSVLVLGSSLKDKDVLFDRNYFSINGQNKITNIGNKNVMIDYFLMKDNIEKIYDYIILCDVIKDKYNDMELDTIISTNNLEKFIYNSYIKCRNNLIILCPASKLDKTNKILNDL